MAEQVQYYKVKVKAIFTAYNEHFVPGPTYWVTPEQYSAQLSDGRNFADVCESAMPETLTVGV